MAIRFFYSPRSSSSRVHWALEELGVPYEKVRVDLSKGEQKAPDFLAVNPYGKVPALIDGEARLFESLAILLHLGERYGVERGLWPAAGSVERAEALSWTVAAHVTTLIAGMEYIYHSDELASPVAWPAGVRQPEIAAYNKGNWEASLKILEARLAGRSHLVGGGFTFADLLTAIVMEVSRSFAKLPLDPYPNVIAWLDRCLARPAFARARASEAA